MKRSASWNSSIPMNWVAGTLPSALGSHGDWPELWQPAIGSGKTRPRTEYDASSVATGDAPACAAVPRNATAATAAQIAPRKLPTPTSFDPYRPEVLQESP